MEQFLRDPAYLIDAVWDMLTDFGTKKEYTDILA